MTPQQVIQSSSILKVMLLNFFAWLIPGALILAISLFVLLMLLGAGAIGIEFDIYKRMPKGLVSFLGIAYGLVGISLILLPILYTMDTQSIVVFIGMAITCFILSYVAIKREIKRIAKAISEREL